MAISEKTVDLYSLPTEETLEEACQIDVLDDQGVKVPFRALTKPSSTGDAKRRLVIFIRHYFCGHCEEYVRALVEHLPPSRLREASTEIVLVGCGQTSLVADYKKRTGCPYEIYSDPERKLYAKLNMVISLDLGKQKPEYLKTSLLGGAVSSFLTIVKTGPKALGGGPFSQNGGEWLFDEGELKWCRRMQNTRDHAEIAEVKEVLGLQQ